ncbi:MAG: hypothetical protein KDJ43_00560, partial [Rhizobiaceae bacterium]|nr:hypothetical protein [Rhizobiaceae bacterium]
VQLAHALFEISDCGGDELAQLITDIAADYDVALSPTNRLRIICDEPPGLLALPQPARSVRIPVIGTVVDDDELGNRVVFNGNGNGHDY